MAEVKFSEEHLRQIAKEKVNFRLSVKIHAIIYVSINIVLGAINLLTVPEYLWVIYPIFGWLVGLVLHFASYKLWASGALPAKTGLILHITAYFSTLLLLAVINYYLLHALSWFFFPAFFWGIIVIVHLIIYFAYFSGEVTEKGEKKSKKERAIEKELEKMKEKMKK